MYASLGSGIWTVYDKRSLSSLLVNVLILKLACSISGCLDYSLPLKNPRRITVQPVLLKSDELQMRAVEQFSKSSSRICGYPESDVLPFRT